MPRKRDPKPRVQLTPELTDQIANYFREGHTPDWIGVTLRCVTGQTIRNWLKRGAKDESGPYRELAEAVSGAKEWAARPKGGKSPRQKLTEAGGDLDTLPKGGSAMHDAHPAKHRGLSESAELTPELIQRFADIIARGNYFEVAAARCGIAPRSAFRWVSRGHNEDDGLYHDFATAIDKADAEGEGKLVDRIEILALQTKDLKVALQAAIWRLQQRHGSRWSDQLPRDARQVIETLLQAVNDVVSPDQYDAILDRLRGDRQRAIGSAITGQIAGYLPVAQ